jgi:DNA-binding FadR family transcriptional regulator
MEDAFAGMTTHVFDPRDASNTWSTFDEHDLAFHQAIYRGTQNLIWTQMTPVIEPALRLVIHQSNLDSQELQDSLARHGRLLTCIRRQDAAGAHAAAIAVLKRTACDLGIALEKGPTVESCVVANGVAGAC